MQTFSITGASRFMLMCELITSVGILTENSLCSEKKQKIQLQSENVVSVKWISLCSPAKLRGKPWEGRKCLGLVDEYRYSGLSVRYCAVM